MSKRIHRARRKDANHAEIVRALHQLGAVVFDVSEVAGLGFDILILHRGQTCIAEIKDGDKPPSRRRLTESEETARDLCEAQGVPYYILKSTADALRLVNGTLYPEAVPPGW